MNPLYMQDVNEITKNGENINLIISGMMALLADEENKYNLMSSQKWYQRMVNTVFGKNKATLEEIKSNREKILAYVTEAVSDLYQRDLINEKVLVSLSKQLSELSNQSNTTKKYLFELASKLNDKIQNLDEYVQLLADIDNDEFEQYDNFGAVCLIVARCNSGIYTDDTKRETIEKRLIKKNILSEAKISLKKGVEQLCGISDDAAGAIYLDMQNCNNALNNLVCCFIEEYFFVDDINRKLLNPSNIVDILFEKQEFEDCDISTIDIWSNLIETKKIGQNIQISPDTTDLSKSDEGMNSYMESADADISEDSISKEELQLDSIQFIPAAEEMKFENKIIHFSALLSCKGTLSFEDCVIFYNESENESWIKIEDDAKLRIVKSIIICKGKGKCVFIQRDSTSKCAPRVAVENSKFINCGKFIGWNGDNESWCGNQNPPKPNKLSLLTVKSCEFINCFGDLFCISKTYTENVDFCNNRFIWNDDWDYIHRGEECSRSFIFKNQDNLINNSEKIFIKNCIFDAQNMSHNKKETFCYGDIVFENSSFIGTMYNFEGTGYARCYFEKCVRPIGGRSIANMHDGTSISIDNCVFEMCKDVISCDGRLYISECQFDNCSGYIINDDFGYNSGRTILNCEFTNLIFDPREFNRNLINHAVISLGRQKVTDLGVNKIVDCKFDGIKIRDAYLISPCTKSDPGLVAIEISGTSFSNCVSNKELINSYVTKKKAFGRSEYIREVTIKNCSGLDKVNSEGSTCNNLIIKECTSKGEKIGYFG